MDKEEIEYRKIFEKAVNRVKGNKPPFLLFGLSASGKTRLIEHANGVEISIFCYSDSLKTDKEIIHKVISSIVGYAHYNKTIVITFSTYDLALRVKELTGLDLLTLGEKRATKEIRTLAFLK